MGVITNGRGKLQRGIIHALGIESYLDVVLVSEEEGVRKPDPLIFRRALERVGVEPEEAVFVGDHPEVDVEGAHAAGLRTIWKREGYWGTEPDADGVVDDLSSIPSMIVGLDARART